MRRLTPMFQVPRLVGLRRPERLLRLGDPPRADVTEWRHPPRLLRCARRPGPSCEFMSIPRERLSHLEPSGPVPRRALPTVVGGPACPFLLQAAPCAGPRVRLPPPNPQSHLGPLCPLPPCPSLEVLHLPPLGPHPSLLQPSLLSLLFPLHLVLPSSPYALFANPAGGVQLQIHLLAPSPLGGEDLLHPLYLPSVRPATCLLHPENVNSFKPNPCPPSSRSLALPHLVSLPSFISNTCPSSNSILAFLHSEHLPSFLPTS